MKGQGEGMSPRGRPIQGEAAVTPDAFTRRALEAPAGWQVPSAGVFVFGPASARVCVLIPVINEGERLLNQLRRMAAVDLGADVVIADGGSSDGSNRPEVLRGLGVRALLIKSGPGKLSAQLRMGFAFALQEGYEGVVTVDGNGKDGVEAIPEFVQKLRGGYGFVQGSRYMPGGQGVNTPLDRHLAVKYLHAPLISLAAGFRYTDTTNGFRALSREFLLDPGLQPFRDIFDKYNLLWYLSVRAGRLGYRVCEVPARREYPSTGQTPTKINAWAGRLEILYELFRCVLGGYDPES